MAPSGVPGSAGRRRSVAAHRPTNWGTCDSCEPCVQYDGYDTGTAHRIRTRSGAAEARRRRPHDRARRFRHHPGDPAPRNRAAALGRPRQAPQDRRRPSDRSYGAASLARRKSPATSSRGPSRSAPSTSTGSSLSSTRSSPSCTPRYRSVGPPKPSAFGAPAPWRSRRQGRRTRPRSRSGTTPEGCRRRTPHSVTKVTQIAPTLRRVVPNEWNPSVSDSRSVMLPRCRAPTYSSRRRASFRTLSSAALRSGAVWSISFTAGMTSATAAISRSTSATSRGNASLVSLLILGLRSSTETSRCGAIFTNW